MKKIENEFKKYFNKNISIKDSYNQTIKKINLQKEKENNFMKRKNIFYAIGGGVLTTAVVLTVVLTNVNKKIEPYALVSVDVNPSIDLVVDKNNNVLSVKGNNEDGKLVLYGEKIVGKDLEDALEIIINIENETGYLVSGNLTANENTITISITADTDKIVESIQQDVSYIVEKVCDKLHIEETIEYIQKYNREKLEEMVAYYDPTLSEEEINKMSTQELLNIISLHYIETYELYSQQLEDLYLQAKDYEIQFTEKEWVKEAIKDVNDLYQIFVQTYSNVVDELQKGCNSINDLRYSLLIDENSTYQKTLLSVINSKNEVLELRKELSELEATSPELETLKLLLAEKEKILQEVINGLEAAQETINETLINAQNALQKVIDSLREVEKSFPEEITSIIEDHLKQQEKAINEVKDNFFNEFEKKYADDIERFKQQLEERKNQLLENVA